MSSLILKLGKLYRPSGQWSDEDYDVLADGKVVGRILELAGSRFARRNCAGSGRSPLSCRRNQV
jgi:hypothetical protein